MFSHPTHPIHRKTDTYTSNFTIDCEIMGETLDVFGNFLLHAGVFQKKFIRMDLEE